MPKQRDNSQQFVRAQFVPSTMDSEKRTVDVTFATDTPVLRYSWRNDEYYNEVLDMKGARLDRAKNGLPVLDNHGRWGSVGQILGRGENIRLEDGVYRATIRFSKRDNVQDIVNDVRDGIISDISFGYSVTKYERQEKKEGQQYRDYVAREWEPNEISFVTIPADPKAGVRSEGDDTPEPEIIDNSNRSSIEMTEAEKKALRDAERQRAADITKAVADAGLSAEFARGLIDNENMTVEAARAAINTEKERVSHDPAKVRDEAIKAERKRAADITSAVRAAKLSDEIARELIDNGKSIDEARAAIIEKFAAADPHKRSNNTIKVGDDNERNMRMVATEAALVARIQPELVNGKDSPYNEDVKKAAANYRGMTLLDFAKDALVRAGIETAGMDKMEIVGRAFTSSSSDFPVLLEGTNRKVLLANYNAVADIWREFCAIGSVSDFREYKRLRMGTFSDLELVAENQEFKTKKITDADFEKIQAQTKGNIINVSRQMIVNDDLAAFTRLASMLGRAAARSIENDVFAMFALNSGNGPTMQDGQPLFHSTHNNIAQTAGAPSVAILDAMRVQMAQHKDKDGNDFLDIRPSLALAPLALGSTLRVLNQSQYDPDATGKYAKPNVVAGLVSKVVDTPRLQAPAYYLFANPSDEPVFEVVFLDGVQTPFMESQNGFTVDGVQWKIRLDYGVGAIGWRGVMKNAGTSGN
jgi:HK97 family phage prohead protease